MATEIIPFSPQLTQQFARRPMGEYADLIDQNLLKIKAALDAANATIIRQQTIINRIISGDTIINITGATGDRGPPGLDADGDTSGDNVPALPGPPGRPGRDGREPRDGLDGEDGDASMIPGPQGKPGRDGAIIMLGDVAEDAIEPSPIIVPPPPRPLFVLALGYGPDNFSGTMPTVAEGRPHFWLHPYTSMDNVSALAVGSSHNDMPIEWEVGASFTRVELDVYVRTSSMSGAGAVVAVSKNGSDTAATVTVGASETNQLHQSVANVSFANLDLVGVHVSTENGWTSGSVIMSVVARLLP